MLEQLLLEMAKRSPKIETLGSGKPNWITKVDESGIYVETESSRAKFDKQEKSEPSELISKEFLIQAWKEFVAARSAAADDFVKTRGRSSFLMAFLSQLPFVEKSMKGRQISIQLMEFKTDDLPRDSYAKMLFSLEEAIKGSGSYVKQDLRLLGFLNENNELVSVLLDEYQRNSDKVAVIQKQVEKHPYNQIILNVLKLISNFEKSQKKDFLVELGQILVRNSQGDNLMVDSVAQKRTSNLLNWMEKVGLIDDQWNPIDSISDLKMKFLDFIKDPYHHFFIQLRRYRAAQLRRLLSQPTEITVSQFNEEVWDIGYALLNGEKVNVFKLMEEKQDIDLLKKLEYELDFDELVYKGNAIWGSGSKVYGPNLKKSDEEKTAFIREAVMILNQVDLPPSDKRQRISSLPGFGENSASGLVMVFHPKKFAIFNAQSKAALEDLGYTFHSIDEFQQQIQQLRDTLEAEDFIELDWFLYCQNQQKGGSEVNFWWVNQGQTHREEKEGGFLWAPKHGKNGQTIPHHRELVNAKKGDIVFTYSSLEIQAIGIVEEEAKGALKPASIAKGSWQEEGNLVKLKYYNLTPTIHKDDIPLQWRLEESGPFDKNGDVKQGYFYPVSKKFVQQLTTIYADFPSEIQAIINEHIGPMIEETVTEKELIEHIYQYILGKGFYYERKDIINLYLSLKTKPFIILSGISGTGKTKIIQWFAESVGATEQNGQFTLIPVRPDWNDGSELLGYVDIKGDFKLGPLTQVLLTAEANPEKPYFILLDEMNLARVEYYFSDLLSVMESRRWEGDKLISSPVLKQEVAARDVTIPANVYFIGTVNMDETTHPFSKKVLDRANTIEFNQVKLDHFAFLHEMKETTSKQLKNELFISKYLHLKDVYLQVPSMVEQVTQELVKVNNFLQLIYAQIGYRVRDEICFYLAYNQKEQLMSFEEAFDHCIHQKILPRISGSDFRVERLLDQLFTFCTNKMMNDDQDELSVDFSYAKYPKSASKVLEMRRRFRSDGFTSFWIS